MKPTISLLLPNLTGGGAERVMIDLASELDRHGCSVEFVLLQATGAFVSEAQQHFVVRDLARSRTREAVWSLARYLRCRRPDALIANMWPLTSVAVIAKALSRQSCRLLLVEHSTLSQQYASWGRLHSFGMSASMAATFRFADQVAAVSEGTALDVSRLARLAPDRVAVLHNPIPQKSGPSPEASSMADTLWSCSPGKRILTVGKLKDQKNHSLLLRAFAVMCGPDTRLMLLGEGENEAALRELASKIGIADRVIFAGFHPDPSAFYATADLFVLSSDYEGFGNVIVEALSFGLPVVSTDCPSGPAEILEGGRFGRLVPVGDAAALAREMGAALADPVDREGQVRRAADFAPEIVARKYLDLLGLC